MIQMFSNENEYFFSSKMDGSFWFLFHRMEFTIFQLWIYFQMNLFQRFDRVTIMHINFLAIVIRFFDRAFRLKL